MLVAGKRVVDYCVKTIIVPGILWLVLGTQLSSCNRELDFERIPDSVRTSVTDRIPRFIDKYHNRKTDLTIVLIDGSISADLGFASKRPDSAYRPPCTTDFNIPSFIEEKLRWSGQQFRRYDANVEQQSSTKVFSETGTAVTRQYDGAWDWQNNPPQQNGYNGMTRILTGSKPSVSFRFPAKAKRNDFIYRTDYLSSAALKVSVGQAGIVEVFDEKESMWREADGFVFSAKEKDELIPGEYFPGQPFAATSLRKSIYQKRLKMRALKSHADVNVSIASTDGGRLCYWGVSFSPAETMLQFINSARGSHNIALLTYFEAWSIDYWKPDLILYSCNTINEGADASTLNTLNSPTNFGDRFETYITRLLNKPYKPEMFAYILFTAKAHGLINEQDVVGEASIKNYGEASVFDFITELDKRLKKLPVASANAFNFFWETAKKNAEAKRTTIYKQMFADGGPKGPGFVSDYTHLNDYGAQVGWQYLQNYFNF